MFDIKLTDVKVEIPAKEHKKLLFEIGRFHLPTGEHIHIHGPSGSGKTTLLHLVSGLFLPLQGVVLIGATRMDHLSDHKRAAFRREHIGVIFQKLNLLDYLTVRENIRLGARGPVSPHMIETALARLGLQERADDLCSVLSLGEQQRVAVARILASQPDIILADEPTSSLDEDNAHRVMDALFESAQGKTMVVVSHDQRLRARFKNTMDFRELIKK